MKTIEDLMALNLSKIGHRELNREVKNMIDDYEELSSNPALQVEFKKKAALNIDTIYRLVKDFTPDAIPHKDSDSPCNQMSPSTDLTQREDREKQPAITPEKKEENSSSGKKDSEQNKAPKKKEEKSSSGKKDSEQNKAPKKKQPKTKASSTEVVDKAKLEIQHCRNRLKQYNAEKRKTNPTPKATRYTKIKGHFISISNLIPTRLKNDLKVQLEAKKILKKSHREILKTFQMNALVGKDDNVYIEEKYDKIAEKLSDN